MKKPAPVAGFFMVGSMALLPRYGRIGKCRYLFALLRTGGPVWRLACLELNLGELIDGITPDNLHLSMDFGAPVG